MEKRIKATLVLFFLSVIFFSLTSCTTKSIEPPQPQATRDPGGESILEQQLGGMNPSAVPVYQEATKNLDAGNLLISKSLYEQVIAMAPNFSTAYRRLGYIELQNNNIEHAEELTRKALALETNSYNESALALVLLQKNTPKDSAEAFDLAAASVKELPDDSQANMTLLMAAAATQNMAVLRQTDETFLRMEPDHPLGHYFAGLLAAYDGSWEKAETELVLSQKFGMSPEVVQKALGSGIARNAMTIRFIRWSGISSFLWLLGFGILFLAGVLLSKATIQTLNKNEPMVNLQVKPQEQKLRTIYRMVITILSIYFYVSIPFVIIALLLVVGVAFYIFFAIGSIPVQIALILVIMLFGSLFAIVRSLFVRRKDVPPGRQLNRIDAPALWELVEEIARKVQIRPVDAIHVTPWPTIAVNENGSILQKLRGRGQRNLILGMGALPELTQGQLSAILAHEYGHFSNQDTAGGDLAHQVYASLHQMAQRLIQGRAAQIFNPVWLFILGYQRIFLRVTQGASRLQEVLADRYAALAYGSQNFIDGLKKIVRQSIAFPVLADFEVRRSIDLNRPVYNLYNLPAEEQLQGEIEKRLEETMKRVTSPYDSHPAIRERIALVEQLHVPYSPMQDNPRPALDLFPNYDELQREMTGLIMKNVKIRNK